MIFFRKIVPLAVIVTAILILPSYQSAVVAAGPKVSELGNKHNLSAANMAVKYRATDDPVNNPRGQQICIFCHTPHSANVVGQAPLWNRNFSAQTFQRYSSDTLQIRSISEAQYADGVQPSGSSKLCLSCHDGVSRLGSVYKGPEITIAGNTNVGDINVIEGLASFNTSTNKMKSGHHPVSFVYTDSVATAINTGKSVSTYQMPALTQYVKLDKSSRMQCTTCHDAHQNQSNDTECYGGTCNATFTRKMAPFWVYGVNGSASADQQAVCTTCHPMITEPWLP